MATVKEELREIVEELPDDATYEDLQYRLYVRRKVERGLKDIEEGRTLTHDEVVKQMQKWLND